MKKTIITISFLLVAIITMAQNAGDLDLSFSGDGKTTINIASGADESYASAIQPDQKIILVGTGVTGQNADIELVRLYTDGQLDSSFGSEGKVVSDFGSNHEYARSVEIQPDDKIVVGGFIYNYSSNYDFALIRYLPNGSLDNTFGTNGKVQTDVFYDDRLYDIALLPDGKILAVGYTVNISGRSDIAIVKYNSDGTLDNSFGTGGMVLTPVGTTDDFGYCIALQSNGKFIVSGFYEVTGNNNDVFVARYNSDGTLDNSFGSNGISLLTIGNGHDEVYSVAIQTDGKIVLGGYTRVGYNNFNLLLIRITSNGSLDSQFGNSGFIIKSFSNADDFGRFVNIQSDGKIILSGSCTINYYPYEDFFICRFNQDGSDDLTFGINGTVINLIGNTSSRSYSSCIQNDGKIILAGSAHINGFMEFAIARYHGQCLLPGQPSEIYGNQTPCEGGSETYNVTSVTGVDYSWILPGDWSIISGQGTNAISVNVGQLSGDIQVTPSTSCGNGQPQTLVTTVEFIPDQPSSIAGITEPCVGTSQIYSVTNINGVTYTWTIPNGSAITLGQGTNSITVNIGPNSGDIQVVPSNICGNGAFSTLFITPQTTPVQPSAISGVSSACENTTNLSYSVSNINGVSYLWQVPNDWTIVSGQGTNSIITNAGILSGNITVTPSNVCGDGIASSLSVNLNAVPNQPGTITGDDNICPGTDQYYSVAAVSGVSYFWSVPAGWTITSGQNSNSISTTTGSTGGTVSVTPSNNCGNGISSILEVTVNLLSVDAGSDQTITNGSSTTLYGNANSGSGNYSWLWSPIELLENPNIQNPNTLALGSSTIFTLTVTDQATACYETDQMIVTVTGGALSVVATAIPHDICIGDNSQLNALASNGSGNYSYSWTSLPQGFTSNLPNPIASPIITTDYIIEVNDGNSTVTDSITVEVSDIPEQPTKPDGPDTVDLHFTSFTSYSTTTTAGASSYSWEITPPEIANLNPNGLEVTLTWQTIGEASLKVYAINECGIVASDSLAIHVDNSVSISQIPFLIEVHPNPTKDFLLITFKGLQIKQINVVNITGVPFIPTVYIENQIGEYNLNLQSLSKGIYFIYLTTNKGIIVKKIIKI